MIRILICAIAIAALGCSVQIGPQGFTANFGQSSVSTCGEIPSQSYEGEQPDVPENCTVIDGAPISEQAGNVVGGLLAGALRIVGMSYGVPATP